MFCLNKRKRVAISVLIVSIFCAPAVIFAISRGLASEGAFAVTCAEGETALTMSFKANGGDTNSVPADIVKCMGDQYPPFTIPNNIPTDSYTHKVFVGWSTSRTSAVQVKQPGDTDIIIASDRTYYAMWQDESEATEQTFTMSFDDGEGEGAPDPVSCTTKNSACIVTIPNDVPTRTNWAFTGWGKQKNSPIWQPGEEVAISASKTAYAGYERVERTISVTYMANASTYGGSDEEVQNMPDPNPATCVGKEACAISHPSVDPTWGGHTFIGWNTNKDATTADSYYSGSGASAIYDDTVLYAIWSSSGGSSSGGDTPTPTSNTFNLTYNANGGSGAPSSQSCTTTGTTCNITVSSTTPTRSGYTFQGWSNSSSATSATYVANSQISLTANKTIYAVWTANSSTGGDTGGETNNNTGDNTGGNTSGNTGNNTGSDTNTDTDTNTNTGNDTNTDTDTDKTDSDSSDKKGTSGKSEIVVPNTSTGTPDTGAFTGDNKGLIAGISAAVLATASVIVYISRHITKRQSAKVHFGKH